MAKYIVEIKEIWKQKILVEADSTEEAKMCVMEGEGDYLEGPDSFESVLTLDSNDWTVTTYNPPEPVIVTEDE